MEIEVYKGEMSRTVGLLSKGDTDIKTKLQIMQVKQRK